VLQKITSWYVSSFVTISSYEIEANNDTQTYQNTPMHQQQSYNFSNSNKCKLCDGYYNNFGFQYQSSSIKREILLEFLLHSNSIFTWSIWGSHGGEYEDGCLLGCSAVYSGRSLPTFQRSLLPPSLHGAITKKTAIFYVNDIFYGFYTKANFLGW
jgi:hypothetical protein